jgi:predicted XRE-type DNA-binding protein
MKKKIEAYDIDEKKMDKKIKAGDINPIHIPGIANLSDVVKYQFCSDIIYFKKINNLKQIELASLLKINKSEISKLCSYNLKEFSQERLIGFVEMLILMGADIDLQDSLEKIKIRSKKIQKKLNEMSVKSIAVIARS